MTVERSWRIIGYNEGYDAGLEHRHMEPQEMLVSDTRLQAIADAWKLFTLTQWKADIRTFNPELGSLLDALTEESECN